MIPANLQKIRSLLVCPACRCDLRDGDQALVCPSCDKSYPIRGGRIHFIDVRTHADDFDQLKARLKKTLGKYYYSVGIRWISPTLSASLWDKIRDEIVPEQGPIVDIGCGNYKINPEVIGLDIFPYEAVDIVGDLDALPFKQDSVQAFVSNSVMEHLPNPQNVVDNLLNCTKPGGFSAHILPFMYHFHASPHDYFRFTESGIDVLFNDWQITGKQPVSGPISLFTTCLVEFLASLAALPSQHLKPYAYLFFAAVLFPIKFLDYFFIRSNHFNSLAPTFLVYARKRSENE